MEERALLKQAREDRNLRQWQVAEAIGCSIDSMGLWERGGGITEYYRRKLCAFYDKRASELDLGEDSYITEGQLAMLQKILGTVNLDRRQALELVKQVPALAVLVELLAEPRASGIVAPSQFLSQCTAVINVCWQQMNSGGYATIESLLPECTTTLYSLVAESKYQDEAASLLTQAKLIQIRLATRDHNFAHRKTLCLEAVEFGELSGDPFLRDAALFWHGDTYVYCYHRPQKAIDIFNKGLKRLDSDSWLNKSKLSINLAIAHAQQGNEALAIKMVEQARMAAPQYPGQDPAYPYVDMIQGNLEKHTGRMHLALSEHLPGYAKSAHEIFGEAAAKSSHQGELSQTLIHQAHAALLFGELDEYARCLKQGWLIARKIDSTNRKYEAQIVLNKGAELWQNERKYQDLVKIF